jgi:Dullard-like phosphatase family protein
MNSISYLDSILTRSLTSSRSGSGTNTPSPYYDKGEGSSNIQSTGQHGHLNRRASDYSLTREREREKRKLAASLGLTALDGNVGRSSRQSSEYQARKSARSSRRGSRTSSARHSEAEEAGKDEDHTSKDAEKTTSARSASSNHPKSYSEGYSDDRPSMRRAGSIPAPIRSFSSNQTRGWGSLWGLGGFIEDATTYDSYMRRQISASSGLRRSRQSEGSVGSGHMTPSRANLEVGSSSGGLRRASTSDADATLAGFAPDALLSEREREDVVDFEGYDPDYDVNTLPNAPPSTPFPGSEIHVKDALGERRSQSEKLDQASNDLSREPSTASKLSSLLFGALNPLTDDYFGPQAAQRSTVANRRRASEASEKKRKSERSRKTSHHSRDSQSEASSSGHGHEGLQSSLSASPEKSTKKTGKVTDTANDSTPSLEKAPSVTLSNSTKLSDDPPPPYTDSEVLSNSPLSTPDERPELQDDQQITRTFAGSAFTRGAQRTFELLKRLFLMILLAPYRLYRLVNRSKVQPIEAQSVREVIKNVEVVATIEKRRESNKGFQTLSQAERPTAARHVARRRASDDWQSSNQSDQDRDNDEGKKFTEINGEDKEKLANAFEESDSDTEVITEDQAEARAVRRAQRAEARRKAEEAKFNANMEKRVDDQVEQQRPRASSRLLPNPHPVDPLLAHDRNAKPLSPEEQKIVKQQQNKLGEAGKAGALVNRGPMSSLIHHSPKVLVLDLDETLIHSTSRSPTWSALADKSKSRVAVTTGGSLLGLEGLGGVLGLRGQVGVRPHQVEVVLDGRSIIYHVYKRPHVDTFLRKVASWYHVVVFTASVQEYADPVIDWLDQGRGLISGRLFRESCTFRNGSYYKNLAFVDSDLSRVCLVDNSPASYMINQSNGIPIEGWTHDPSDEALLDLLPVLDSLRFASDVRHILGIRGFSDPAFKALPPINS